jgi:AraC-like DNA-binding protein
LSHPGTTLAAAATHGYADQAHLTREVRALAGVAPSALFAFVQDTLQRSTYRPEACS